MCVYEYDILINCNMCLKFRIAFRISFVKLKHTLHVRIVQILSSSTRPLCIHIHSTALFSHRYCSRYYTVFFYLYMFFGVIIFLRYLCYYNGTHSPYTVCRMQVVMMKLVCMMHAVLLLIRNTLAKKEK